MRAVSHPPPDQYPNVLSHVITNSKAHARNTISLKQVIELCILHPLVGLANLATVGSLFITYEHDPAPRISSLGTCVPYIVTVGLLLQQSSLV